MINIDNLPIKYITGSYKYDKSYPTQYDLLWEIANIGKNTVFVEDICSNKHENIIYLLQQLEKNGFILLANNKITLLKTPWSL